jgi:hypothetical protein
MGAGGTGSVSRPVQPASHVPGQNRLAEHNNYTQHRSSRTSACGGSGGNSSSPGLDDDFGGIDWDAAVLQLDAPSSSKTTSATTQSVASVAKNEHSSSSMAAAATTAGSSGMIDLTDSPPPPPTKTDNNNTRIPTATVMTAVSLKPPLHSKAVATSSPSKASVQHPAMLQRPEAWTTGTANAGSPASVSSNTANITVDPLQVTLPKALQFEPGQVKPVNDEHRALLVKNAQLASPLDNGWTLFSHQKKAILRGLLMRRMILALDMGLG